MNRRLFIGADDGFILKGTKVVIPSKLRNRVVNLAHEGHQEIVKIKSLLREKVSFPGIDQMVENIVKNCIPCQATGQGKARAVQNVQVSPWALGQSFS